MCPQDAVIELAGPVPIVGANGRNAKRVELIVLAVVALPVLVIALLVLVEEICLGMMRIV